MLCLHRKFLPYVKAYAEDEQLFFKDFGEAFAALLAKGCPAHCRPDAPKQSASEASSPAEKEFRDLAMHGSLQRLKDVVEKANGEKATIINSTETHSGRTALHKAAFFGHHKVVAYLCNEQKASVNMQDLDGDTALHDASRFGHLTVVKVLLAAGADKSLKNMDGKLPIELASANKKEAVVEVLK